MKLRAMWTAVVLVMPEPAVTVMPLAVEVLPAREIEPEALEIVAAPIEVLKRPDELLKSMLPLLLAAVVRVLFCARTTLPFRLFWPLDVSNVAVDPLKLNCEPVPPAVKVLLFASTVLPFRLT